MLQPFRAFDYALCVAAFFGSEQESVKALILGGFLESHIWYQTPA
jgi:hypothetical protein